MPEGSEEPEAVQVPAERAVQVPEAVQAVRRAAARAVHKAAVHIGEPLQLRFRMPS